MPIKRTTNDDGKPAYQYGDHGHKYEFEDGDKESENEALEKAKTQMRAIQASQHREHK